MAHAPHHRHAYRHARALGLMGGYPPTARSLVDRPKELYMSSPAKNLGIVVGVDGSACSKVRVYWATRDAALRNVPLRLVSVVNPMPVALEQWRKEQAIGFVEDARRTAEENSADDRPVKIKTEVLFSATVPTLIDLSKEAEMLVVGCRGRGALCRVLIGSVSTWLVRHAHCPVAGLHDADRWMPPPAQSPVLVGIDGSPASELATAIAFDEASRRGVGLVALHAWSDTEVIELPGLDWSAVKSQEELALAERLAGWQERYPDVAVDRLLGCDKPARQLIERSDSAQLVVVGSHGRGGFAGMLLGSVDAAGVHGARRPVIVARRP